MTNNQLITHPTATPVDKEAEKVCLSSSQCGKNSKIHSISASLSRLQYIHKSPQNCGNGEL